LNSRRLADNARVEQFVAAGCVDLGETRDSSRYPNGTNVVAPIQDGRFSLPADQGPTQGRYRVEFSGPSANKRRTPNDDIPGEFIEEAPETLPPRYHRDSTITQELDPDNTQPLSFALTAP
jgi:hypothetical protein